MCFRFSVVRKRVACSKPLECALQSAAGKGYMVLAKRGAGTVEGRNIAYLKMVSI